MGKYKDIKYELANDNFYYDETSPSFLRWKVDKGNKKRGILPVILVPVIIIA
ncbi:hypothetical protein [Salmonella phage Stp1]|uniref:Uncharacterized protein n=1 Tax=Salmonella phage Stp1 TaxID=1971233 RepID=A0A240FFV9_9CAUD|nr:hypothetical protein [Salmonella phage Stp1]